MKRGLGRRVPKDFDHVAKYPLRLATMPRVPAPIASGINWYDDFDHPIQDKDGKYWIGKNPNKLGSIRGGHCVCIPHLTSRDLPSWYKFYDQGEEGACVGFGSSRMMSLLNRKQFDPWWLWNQAKIVDEWPDTNPGDDNGTSVRAAMDILRLKGHVLKGKTVPSAKEGILENRWATNIDDAFTVLQNDAYKKLGALPFLNSWGSYYPHIVWMPCETWDRLMKEDGEFTMITDLP
jgi:hypothetical protein